MTYPTIPDTTITTGDHVRSFDFPGRTDCFMEGVVIGIETWGVYVIKATRQVVEGVERPLARPDGNFCPPVNGTQGIFGLNRGVVRI